MIIILHLIRYINEKKIAKFERFSVPPPRLRAKGKISGCEISGKGTDQRATDTCEWEREGKGLLYSEGNPRLAALELEPEVRVLRANERHYFALYQPLIA